MTKKKKFGALICCSSNAVMNTKSIKRLIDYLSLMDYNLLEIAIDDIYRIEGEPYFGYLRGGYFESEIKEIDEYARKKVLNLFLAFKPLLI